MNLISIFDYQNQTIGVCVFFGVFLVLGLIAVFAAIADKKSNSVQ